MTSANGYRRQLMVGRCIFLLKWSPFSGEMLHCSFSGGLSFLLDLNIKNQPQLLSWIPIMNDFILETLHCHNVERIVTHHSLPMWWFHSKFEKKSTRHTYNQFFQLRFLSPSFSYTFKPSAMTRLRKPVFFPWFFMEARGNCKPA